MSYLEHSLGVFPLCREVVGVLYSSSRLGNIFLNLSSYSENIENHWSIGTFIWILLKANIVPVKTTGLLMYRSHRAFYAHIERKESADCKTWSCFGNVYNLDSLNSSSNHNVAVVYCVALCSAYKESPRYFLWSRDVNYAKFDGCVPSL